MIFISFGCGQDVQVDIIKKLSKEGKRTRESSNRLYLVLKGEQFGKFSRIYYFGKSGY